MGTNGLKIRSHITLGQLSAAPASPVNGDIFYDSTLNQFRKYENGAWGSLATALLTTKGDILARTASADARLGVGGNGTVLTADSAETTGLKWASPAAGVKNYISNPDAEGGTTGWSTYDDGAVARPVDGTAGSSSTLTLTASPTAPLRGTQSFSLVKSAANGQGEGISYDFAIDKADRAKVLGISFDYEISAGTYSGGSSTTDSDLIAYIYRVDATGRTIEPAGFKIDGAVVGTQYKFVGTFQTDSDATNYRLILHVATTTSAVGWTFKFDNVRVGPQEIVNGTPVTDWVAFSPVWTAVAGSFALGNGSTTGFWRRVGDTMEITQKLNIGSTTTCTGALSASTPAGYTRASSKYPAEGPHGIGTYLDATTGPYDLLPYDWTSNGIVWQLDKDAGNGGNLTGTSPVTWASGDYVSIKFSVPIEGWSSNTQMSNSTDTRVVAAIYSTAAAQGIAASDEVVDYGTKVQDTHGAVTTGASWKFTAPVPGFYDVSAVIYFQSASYTAAQGIFLYLYKNGSLDSFMGAHKFDGAVTDLYGTNGAGSVYLNAGEYIDVRAYNGRGETAMLANANYNRISISLRSGPSQIAASESIYLSAKKTSGSHTSNASEQIVSGWDASPLDSHGSFTVSSGEWTCPAAGVYDIDSIICLDANNTGLRYSSIRKNGTAIKYSVVTAGTTSAGNYVSYTEVSELVRLVAGDIISVYVYQGSGGNLAYNNASTGTRLMIKRIGN